MDFSADCTILTAMISRVQSYEKLLKKFPGVLPHLECDTLTYAYVDVDIDLQNVNVSDENR